MEELNFDNPDYENLPDVHNDDKYIVIVKYVHDICLQSPLMKTCSPELIYERMY